MPTNLGTAYVQILPSTRGIAGQLTDALNGAVQQAGVDGGGRYGSGFGSAFSSALGTAAQVGGAAVAAAATGVSALTKSAIESYADYEQLIGGIDTLYKDLSVDVEAYANQAFQSAGLSANEYMETAMSFAASLNQSLMASEGGISRSAEVTNQTIIDMADNANKMGTSMESIQNAYQGFAKMNFTMLDNLKLGYGGTATEMARLINDSGVLGDTMIDLSDTAHIGAELQKVGFATMAEAIHVIQTEMGITGTTAEEASDTITGSMNSLSSAWSNLITGFAKDDEDLDKLIDDVIVSAETAMGNLLPVAEKALDGMADSLVRFAPIVGEKLPDLASEILPALLSTATTLTESLVDALPTILQVLVDEAPPIVGTLVDAAIEQLPAIADLGLQMVLTLTDGLAESLPEMVPATVDMVLEIVDTLTDPDTLSGLVGAALEITVALADGLIEAMPELIEKAPEIIANLVTALIEAAPQIQDASWELVTTMISGIVDMLPSLWEMGYDMVYEVWEGLTSMDPWQWGKDLIDNFIDGLASSDIVTTVSGIAGTISSYLHHSTPDVGPLANDDEWMPDMMDNFVKGIREGEPTLRSQIASTFDLGTEVSVLRQYSPAAPEPAAAQSSGSRLEANVEHMYRLMTAYLPQLAQMAVYLGKDETVGYLAPGVDSALGAMQTRGEREGSGFAWG